MATNGLVGNPPKTEFMILNGKEKEKEWTTKNNSCVNYCNQRLHSICVGYHHMHMSVTYVYLCYIVYMLVTNIFMYTYKDLCATINPSTSKIKNYYDFSKMETALNSEMLWSLKS